RMPGSVGQRSQLSVIRSTLDAGAGAARRSDNSTKHRRSRFITPPNSCASFQPLPNTDPGLAGETGVSRDEGTVYGVDGLKIGAGSEGTLFSQGPPTPRPMWPPRAPPPPPPPRPAASASVAAAAVSMTAARTIIVLRESDLCLML